MRNLLYLLLSLLFPAASLAQGALPDSAGPGSYGVVGNRSARGLMPVAMPDADYTLNVTQWWSLTLYVTGTLSATHNLILPPNPGQDFHIFNYASQSIVATVAGSSDVTIAAGTEADIDYVNGHYARTGGGSSTGGVTSFNGRTGPVALQASDVAALGTLSNSTTGNAATASAAASAPGQCASGQAATGVDASFNAAGCFTPSGGGTGNVSGTLTPGMVPKATAANALGDSSIQDNGSAVSIGEPVTVTSGTPGTVTPSVKVTGQASQGCASFNADGTLVSTGTPCPNTNNVQSINTLTGNVTIVGGADITVSQTGQQLAVIYTPPAAAQSGYTSTSSPSRALNTIFTNTSTAVLLVTVSCTGTGAYNCYAITGTGLSAGSTSAGNEIAAAVGSGDTRTLTFWVQPGMQYQVVSAAGSFLQWWELILF